MTFGDVRLVANAGLLLVSTLAIRLGIEDLINTTIRLVGRIRGALPGRKVLTRTLHANVDDPSALIHPLDGVVNTSTVEGFEGYAGAVGGPEPRASPSTTTAPVPAGMGGAGHVHVGEAPIGGTAPS